MPWQLLDDGEKYPTKTVDFENAICQKDVKFINDKLFYL